MPLGSTSVEGKRKKLSINESGPGKEGRRRRREMGKRRGGEKLKCKAIVICFTKEDLKGQTIKKN